LKINKNNVVEVKMRKKKEHIALDTEEDSPVFNKPIFRKTENIPSLSFTTFTVTSATVDKIPQGFKRKLINYFN